MSKAGKTGKISAALDQELFDFVEGSDGGQATDVDVRQHFGNERYEQLVPSFNNLLGQNRLQLFTQLINGTSSLVYKAVLEEKAAKFEGLNQEQILVYQTIERSFDKGIWTRDIKNETNIPQHNLTKSLKVLEQRMLVKSVRSVTSKSKKLYMLSEVTPAKEVTGGPWYSDDQEFDYAFVAALGDFVVQLITQHGMLDLTAISEKVKLSGISRVELTNEEVQLVVDTLVFDGRIDDVQSSVLLITGYAAAKKVYKASKPMAPTAYLTESPCGKCPVIANCVEGGVVSPTTCDYMTQWLANGQGLDLAGRGEGAGEGGQSMDISW